MHPLCPDLQYNRIVQCRLFSSLSQGNQPIRCLHRLLSSNLLKKNIFKNLVGTDLTSKVINFLFIIEKPNLSR